MPTRSLHARADVTLMHSRSYLLCVCECVCEMRGGAVCTRDFLVDCSEFSHRRRGAVPRAAPKRCVASVLCAAVLAQQELVASRCRSSAHRAHSQSSSPLATHPKAHRPTPPASGSLPASPIVASWCPCMWAVVWLIAADVYTHGLTLEPYGFRTLKAVAS